MDPCWPQTHYVGFVMTWLKSLLVQLAFWSLMATEFAQLNMKKYLTV
jgi:hypothetical protein